MPTILDLVQRTLSEEERSEASIKLSFGVIGDLADSFPNGQIKNFLLAGWIASEFRNRSRMPAEAKKTLRWAREVRLTFTRQ